ncbi:hypothetical protein A2890_00575 [candidate division WWE3 bacterium RIFCSPLOWO2_01_FULL_53_14]|uniref:Nucleotidyltransferase n=1 Tax=candidate division WWE3 bacterium RIFCSPLOWO2_01_FULL_53_14 TaxID=1802628 RepID=A0A1F4VZD3_UNCKA|nr:MAG: hypothetical protein A2890_00575 [candidate division WWE3 bacterium RIFCSPLOWO2_01_FULL_53_14]
MDIFTRVKKFKLPAGQYAVFGSALLDVWGLRKAADLDIIVTPELYQKLKEEGWKERQAHGFPMLVKEDANITTVQDKPTDGDYNPDRLQLIKEAIKIKGIPFVKVEEVIACKKAYNRPKDLQDIKLLEDYLFAHGKAI